MIIKPTPLLGAYIVEIERKEDERGFFARTACEHEFSALDLAVPCSQTSISFSKLKGTLRGLHFQAHPHREVKLVRCTRGAVFDVIVNINRASPQFGGWHGLVIEAATRNAHYIGRDFAHGFLTLTDEAELVYQISPSHAPGAARTLLWNDPTVGVKWLFPPVIMSARDRAAAKLEDVAE